MNNSKRTVAAFVAVHLFLGAANVLAQPPQTSAAQLPAGSTQAITATSPRMAGSLNMNLGIVDDQTYDEAMAAICSAEFVKYDYTNNPRPRVVGVVAALIEFATLNPLADEAQLALFAQAYGDAFLAATPGDPELRRSANFLPAIRFKTISSVPGLEGLDTNIGPAAMALLNIDVPEPFDFQSLQSRMVGYESARGRTFVNSSEWSNLLVLGLLGRDCAGADKPEIKAVLTSFLETEGFEPVPDGIDDERFAPVNAGISQLPATFSAYQTAITTLPMEDAPPIFTDICAQFGVIGTCIEAQIVDITNAEAAAPTLLEALDDYNSNPSILDDLAAELQSRLDEIATPRTVLAANTLLMFQSLDPDIQSLAIYSQVTTSNLSATFDWMAVLGASLTIAGGVATVAGGVALATIGSPTGVAIGVGVGIAIIGAGITIGGIVQMVDALKNGGTPSAAEEAIFAQIIAIREDIENMRVQMNQRFDRIETQLNIVYLGLAAGLNALGMQIGDLQESVDDLTRDVMINRAALERIEEALYGLATTLLDADLAGVANNYMDYRGFNGVDLSYAGTPSFLDGSNEFFTVAADIASNTALAGPLVSTLSVATASETLNDPSIGRNVNDLRVFPQQLGLPVLTSGRIVAPAPWSQGAAAYAQFAHENPWYFAYQYEQQILSGGTTPDIERVVQEGEGLANTMTAGQDQALFDALFDGYNNAVADLQTAIDLEVLVPLGMSDGVTSIDPWGPTDQNVQSIAPEVGPFSLNGGGLLTLPVDPSNDYWGWFLSDEPETAALLWESLAEPVGNVSVGVADVSASSIQMQFAYCPEPDEPMVQRTVTLDLADPNPGAELVVPTIWDCIDPSEMEPLFRDAILSSLNLEGEQYAPCDFPFGLDVVSDISSNTNWSRQVFLGNTGGVANDRFGDSVAISGDTMIIGVPYDDHSGKINPGSAYIYTRTGTDWTQQAKLTIQNPQDYDSFGYSVAISSDTVIVGSPNNDLSGGNTSAGSAFVFTRTADVWSQQVRLDHPTPNPGDNFGHSVDIDGDMVIVGAPRDDYSGGVDDRGSAFAFQRNGNSWSQLGNRLSASDGAAFDLFGWSAAVSGDRVVVGAYRNDIMGNSDAGSAYVFHWDGLSWSEEQRFLAHDGVADDNFGWSIDISGDTVVVGSPDDDSPAGTDQGSSYVFTRLPGGSTWSEQAKITDPDSMAGDSFGSSVAISDDILVIGALFDDNPYGASGASDDGSVSMFTRTGAYWSLEAKIVYKFGQSDDFLGESVAIDGDSIVAGAPGRNGGGGLNQGATNVYTFVRGGSTLASFISQELVILQPIVLSTIISELQAPGSNLIKDSTEALSDWESLIEAYAVFSLPFAMETSDVLHAALGGSPLTSEVALSGDAILPVAQLMLLDEIPQQSISSLMLERSAIAQQEINDALAADPQGHPYLNYMLGELRHLRDHAFDLAVPDTYVAIKDTPLVVSPGESLMNNDVDQACRTIEVDTMFFMEPEYIAPSNGQVVVNADGTFTYTPDPGFIGTDRFNYRTGTFVNGVGCQPGPAPRGLLDQHVFSNPADVVILVQASCPTDINGDNIVDTADLGILLGQFGSAGPDGDLNGDGVVDTADLGILLGAFGTTCS